MVAEAKVLVRFSDVGRGKRSWVAKLPVTNLNAIWREVRRNGGLASRDVDVSWDDESATQGTVYVGGFRPAGVFRLEHGA